MHSDIPQYRAWKNRLREDAEVRVDLSLTITARRLLAYPHLVELEIGLGEAAADAFPYSLRRVLGACRAALEALFQELASQYSLRGLANALYTGNTPNRNRQFVQECYRTAAKSAGISGELPRSLLSVGQNKSELFVIMTMLGGSVLLSLRRSCWLLVNRPIR